MFRVRTGATLLAPAKTATRTEVAAVEAKLKPILESSGRSLADFLDSLGSKNVPPNFQWLAVACYVKTNGLEAIAARLGVTDVAVKSPLIVATTTSTADLKPQSPTGDPKPVVPDTFKLTPQPIMEVVQPVSFDVSPGR